MDSLDAGYCTKIRMKILSSLPLRARENIGFCGGFDGGFSHVIQKLRNGI
jgi:hypothetical protein